MRSLHILFILVVVTWLGFPLRAQEAISIGTRHTLFSHVLNEAREYWVYVPATRPGEKEESYPVLYSRQVVVGIHQSGIEGDNTVPVSIGIITGGDVEGGAAEGILLLHAGGEGSHSVG